MTAHDTTADAVERVAQALSRDNPQMGGIKDGIITVYTWEESSEAYRDRMRSQARAAIAAMPTPPVAVTEAAEFIPDYVSRVRLDAEPLTAYWTVTPEEWQHDEDGGRWCIVEDELATQYRISYMVESIPCVRDYETQWDCFRESGGWAAIPENLGHEGVGPTITEAIRDAVRRAMEAEGDGMSGG